MSDDDDGLNTAKHYGAIQIPAGSSRVTDADEEVFLLYTYLAARGSTDGSTGFRGLGHVDSSSDTLTVELALDKPTDLAASESTRRLSKKTSRKARQGRTLSVELAQDKTALRSRKGDTGSVVWHASVDFAQTVLQQYHAQAPDALLNAAILREGHVLELGAGTGLLSVVLSPLVARYTATDVEELIPLIRKNIKANLPTLPHVENPNRRRASSRGKTAGHSSNVIVESLDWVALHTATPSARRPAFSYPAIDLLLVVDCIYHPSLLPALLSTIDHLTEPGRTAVLVIVELRAEDVVREFLRLWLDLSSQGQWRIWSVNGFLDGPYATWIGWKTVPLVS